MKFILPFFVLLFINGCSITKQPEQKKTPVSSEFTHVQEYISDNPEVLEHISDDLNITIIDIAKQLLDSNHTKDQNPPLRIILTSFVDLNDLEETNTFGRLISESMFNELHIRDFKVSDFRGQNAISVNQDGEFHITRDLKKLRDNIEATEFILVGTYVKFENKSILINTRIVDSISGDVKSSARAIYRPKDCSIFDVCDIIKSNNTIIKENNTFEESTNTFSIIPDKENY